MTPQTLIDALPDITLIVDESGSIEFANRACERLLRYTPRELAGNKINFLFTSRDGTPLTSLEPAAIPVEVTALRKDGTSFRARITKAPVEDSTPRRTVLSIRTADLLNELQPRALQMSRIAVIADIAGSVAHELNQPLSAIANYAQAVKWLLEDPAPDRAEISQALNEIASQAVRAGSILRNLRAVIQKGEAQRERTTLEEVIHEIKALLATEARLQSVRIVFEVARNLPPIEVDRIQIQQVLLNLIRNAVAALENTPREQREIQLAATLRSDGGIDVSVSDTGPGMTADAHYRLLHSGLGLPMSKMIVEAHDGALVYKQNEPRGASFSFHLPAAEGR